MGKWPSWSTISLVGLLRLVAAQTFHNFTVDDNSPRIVYVGTWEPAAGHPSVFDFGGSHVVSLDPNASATFSFIGRSTPLMRLSSLLTFATQPNDERGGCVL